MSGLTTIALRDDFQLTEDHILCEPPAPQGSGLPIYRWAKTPQVHNKFLMFYDFNVPGMKTDDFATRQLFTADESVQRHGAEPIVDMAFRGIRTALGGQTIVDQKAVGFSQYFAYPAPYLRLSTVYLMHKLEILDEVRITHSFIKNINTGALGLFREKFLVLNVSAPTLGVQGYLDLELLWVAAIETSAAPVGVSTGLIPPTLFFDDTDQSIPFQGSVDVATSAGAGQNVKGVRIGLKATAYRWWSGRQIGASSQADPLDCGQPIACLEDPPNSYVRHNSWTINSQVLYRVEYKTASAPNQLGTGGDPLTGWIEILPQTARGNTNVFATLFGTGNHATGPTFPGATSEDRWTLDFPTLAGEPNEYRFRIHFTGYNPAGDPGTGPDILLGGFCPCPSTFEARVLQSDVRTLSLDFIETQQ